MFVRVHCSAVDVRKINSAPPFFGGGAKSGAASGGGAHFRKSQAENRDGKGLPVQTFLSTPETYKHLSPTRFEADPYKHLQSLVGQTFRGPNIFSGRRGPAPRRRARSSGCLYVECLYGSAPRGGGAMLGPRNVCTGRVHPTRTNICTQIRSTRPVQTF